MDSQLPWHQPLWHTLLNAWSQQRLPHSLLLCGTKGMGKAIFARQLAEFLLCEHPRIHNDIPKICGYCKPCLLLKAHTHPDLFRVEPAEEGKQIAIDQIRQLIEFCTLTANYGRHQIIILNPAEAMNQNAANSLLKLLEEPPKSTMLLLISHRPSALLATIRSRCQRFDFSRPDKTVAHDWLTQKIPNPQLAPLLLNLSAHAPLAALNLVEGDELNKRRELFDTLTQLPQGKLDPVKIAEQWNKQQVAQILHWMLIWTMDLIRYSQSRNEQVVINQDYREPLQRLARQVNSRYLFKLLDLQQDAYRLVMGTSNVKTQGLLETIAIAWTEFGR
jgi:DNA polymerase-3 subunit delta'